MSSSFDPPESLPRGCSQCERDFAEVGEICPKCAIAAAIDDGNLVAAFALADDFNVPHVDVGRMIRDQTAYQVRAEASNSAFRALRLALKVHDSLPANDVMRVAITHRD